MLAQGEQANEANLAPFQGAASKTPELGPRFSFGDASGSGGATSLFGSVVWLFSLFCLNGDSFDGMDKAVLNGLQSRERL